MLQRGPGGGQGPGAGGGGGGAARHEEEADTQEDPRVGEVSRNIVLTSDSAKVPTCGGQVRGQLPHAAGAGPGEAQAEAAAGGQEAPPLRRGRAAQVILASHWLTVTILTPDWLTVIITNS